MEHVCAWFENREPGIVDKHCREQRIWQKGQADCEGRPRIVLPGLDREDSQFAREIADVIAPKHIWFIKGSRTVSIAMVRYSEKAESLGFVPVEPIEARTAVEDHLQTGIVQTDQQTGDPVFLSKTMTRFARAAASRGSWVTHSVGRRRSANRRASKLRISCLSRMSRLANGSSSKSA